MNKILVVNVNWVGDVIFSSPIFRALKKNYPDASITCLAPPRVREILEMNSYVDEIMTYDEKERHFTPLAKLKLILELRKKNFDIAFLLHRSWTRAFLIFLAGIPERVGYDTKRRGCLLTHKVKEQEGQVHRSGYYLNVIESFGILVEDRTCEMTVSDKDRDYAKMLLEKNAVKLNDYFVVVNAGGNWNLKRWSEENFSLLINRLSKEPNVKVAICGAPGDVDLGNRIAESASAKPIILVGKTNLKQLAAIMERANCVISADSGPLHITNCVGTATICLFGPTRPEITGPRGKGEYSLIQNDVGCNRNPCYRLDCPDNACMKSIIVDDVIKEFRKIRD